MKAVISFADAFRLAAPADRIVDILSPLGERNGSGTDNWYMVTFDGNPISFGRAIHIDNLTLLPVWPDVAVYGSDPTADDIAREIARDQSEELMAEIADGRFYAAETLEWNW